MTGENLHAGFAGKLASLLLGLSDGFASKPGCPFGRVLGQATHQLNELCANEQPETYEAFGKCEVLFQGDTMGKLPEFNAWNLSRLSPLVKDRV